MKKNTIWSGYYKRKKRYWFTACILLSLVILLACIMMVYGNTIYMPGTVLEVLKGNETKGAAFTIKTLRLPRMLAAIFCGAAFGLAGNTFQKLLGNPLASPDIIGVTSGASVAAFFGILVLKWNGNIYSGGSIRITCFLCNLFFCPGRRFLKWETDSDRNRHAGILKCFDFLDAVKGFGI